MNGWEYATILTISIAVYNIVRLLVYGYCYKSYRIDENKTKTTKKKETKTTKKD